MLFHKLCFAIQFLTLSVPTFSFTVNNNENCPQAQSLSPCNVALTPKWLWFELCDVSVTSKAQILCEGGPYIQTRVVSNMYVHRHMDPFTPKMDIFASYWIDMHSTWKHLFYLTIKWNHNPNTTQQMFGLCHHHPLFFWHFWNLTFTDMLTSWALVDVPFLYPSDSFQQCCCQVAYGCSNYKMH